MFLFFRNGGCQRECGQNLLDINNLLTQCLTINCLTCSIQVIQHTFLFFLFHILAQMMATVKQGQECCGVITEFSLAVKLFLCWYPLLHDPDDILFWKAVLLCSAQQLPFHKGYHPVSRKAPEIFCRLKRCCTHQAF